MKGMNNAVIAAIKERLELGNSKDQILNELREAGYPAEVAEEAYRAATTTVMSSDENHLPTPLPSRVTVDAIATPEKSAWLDLEEKTDEDETEQVIENPIVSSTPSTLPVVPRPTVVSSNPPVFKTDLDHSSKPAPAGFGTKQWAVIAGSVIALVVLIGGGDLRSHLRWS